MNDTLGWTQAGATLQSGCPWRLSPDCSSPCPGAFRQVQAWTDACRLAIETDLGIRPTGIPSLAPGEPAASAFLILDRTVPKVPANELCALQEIIYGRWI